MALRGPSGPFYILNLVSSVVAALYSYAHFFLKWICYLLLKLVKDWSQGRYIHTLNQKKNLKNFWLQWKQKHLQNYLWNDNPKYSSHKAGFVLFLVGFLLILRFSLHSNQMWSLYEQMRQLIDWLVSHW